MFHRLRHDKLHQTSKSVFQGKISFSEKVLLIWMAFYTCILSGYALSAVQLGVARKIVYVSLSTFPHRVLINLQVTDLKPHLKQTSQEICLSIKGIWELERPQHIRATWNDWKGKQHSFETTNAKLIQILCHEYDHTKGILISDIGRQIS